MADAVALKEVVKRFEGSSVNAVDGLNLQIAGGEFFSLLGASGCGKTTVLRMIAGFTWADSGEIFIKGQSMGETPPYKRPVNTVFQSYALFEHMTIAQNVAFGLEMEKLPKAQINRRVAETLELVQLPDFAQRRPHQLSGGQQQRVALARALVKRPAVLLLDEPLSALDLKLRQQMQQELKTIQRHMGITFIFVTHDQEEALTMSDRIGVMHQGRLLQVGSPNEVYERPKSRFVAEFVGEINTLVGAVVAVKGQSTGVEIPVLGKTIWGMAEDTLQIGQSAIVCIRPEKLQIFGNGENHFAGQIIDTTYLGASTRQVIDLGNGIHFKLLAQNCFAQPTPWSRSESVNLAVRLADVRILPQEVP
ncbi:MAG: ABC transporter ATP-binding protein [Anaerolineae bacterium]|nr:ABC transporter ATP-binding protein [Gloeobacterales cyanobacterium ES-bin-313]